MSRDQNSRNEEVSGALPEARLPAWASDVSKVGIAPFLRLLTSGAVLLVFVALSLFQCLAEEYSMEGNMFITRSDKNQAPPLTANFWVGVSGTNFSIRVFGLGDTNTAFIEYGSMTNGGTYMLIRYETNLSVAEYVDHQGHLVKLEVPVAPINSGTLWLDEDNARRDLGAGCFFALRWACTPWAGHREAGKLLIETLPPFFETRDKYLEQGGRVGSAFSFSSSTPNLLESMVQVLTGPDYNAVRLTAPFAGVRTNASYRVVSWTNSYGLLTPHQFEMIRADTRSPASIVFQGHVDKVTIDPGVANWFAIPNGTRVTESRFGDGIIPRTFSYLTTNGLLWTKERIYANTNFLKAISENETFIRELQERESASHARRRSVTPLRAIVMFMLLSGPIAIAIWVWLLGRKKACLSA